MKIHGLLTKFLQKNKISGPDELRPEEKAIWDNWQGILSKEELTLPDVKEFCASQIGIIEGKWRSYELEDKKKAELIPYHTIYKTILNVIESPRTAREALERQLTEMTK